MTDSPHFIKNVSLAIIQLHGVPGCSNVASWESVVKLARLDGYRISPASRYVTSFDGLVDEVETAYLLQDTKNIKTENYWTPLT